MLEFTHVAQQYPEVQEAAERKRHYQEIYQPFSPEALSAQAGRCSQCGVPFCQVHCPLQNNIPDWLRLTAEGRLREAYDVSSATNTFPEICGRICPQDKLCEGNCVIEKDFGAVTIGAIEKTITEIAFAEGWVHPAAPARESGLSVGIIGAGPAGLAAADMLRRAGHAVHVYDRHDRVGGLLIYGIPNFKLDKHVVARREALLRASGIQFHLNHEVTDLAALRHQHHAVLIATGVYQARALEVPDASLEGIVPALEYLIASNRASLGDALPASTPHAEGKDVVVIGGGDTAMDCVRTAVRQGAKTVTCLYRRDRANMPGSAREVHYAEAEGVRFEWLATPRAFIGNTQVEGMRAARMRLLAGAHGRQEVAPIEGADFTLKATLAIQALGFEAEDLSAQWRMPSLVRSERGTLAIHPRTFETSVPGVFAAGDIVRGASLVVWAIRDGRDAAAAIHHFLTLNQRNVA